MSRETPNCRCNRGHARERQALHRPSGRTSPRSLVPPIVHRAGVHISYGSEALKVAFSSVGVAAVLSAAPIRSRRREHPRRAGQDIRDSSIAPTTSIKARRLRDSNERIAAHKLSGLRIVGSLNSSIGGLPYSLLVEPQNAPRSDCGSRFQRVHW